MPQIPDTLFMIQITSETADRVHLIGPYSKFIDAASVSLDFLPALLSLNDIQLDGPLIVSVLECIVTSGFMEIIDVRSISKTS